MSELWGVGEWCVSVRFDRWCAGGAAHGLVAARGAGLRVGGPELLGYARSVTLAPHASPALRGGLV